MSVIMIVVGQQTNKYTNSFETNGSTLLPYLFLASHTLTATAVSLALL